MLLLTSNSNRVSASEYADATDFLNRAVAEKKMNETVSELFALLYGEAAYKLLLSQGYFNPASN
jgi:hypothetical protein